MSYFTNAILTWFDKHPRRHFPWQTGNVYHIWLSEIMLQQTQVKSVIIYFERFIRHFPNINSLASTSLDEVMRYWAGLGYYARGRNLHKSAQIISKKYNGIFPKNFAQILALPGIGKSTAGAIMSFAYGARFAILDANVKRVLCRYYLINQPTITTSALKILWQLAWQNTPRTRVSFYTQAIMDLGATLCTHRMPKCSVCPLSANCLALKNNMQHKLPIKKANKIKPVKQTKMLAIINNEGKIYLHKRPENGVWGGLWSLPECAPEMITKSVVRALGLTTKSKRAITSFRHTFTHFHLDIDARVILTTDVHTNENWHTLSNIKVGVPKPTMRIIEILKTSL